MTLLPVSLALFYRISTEGLEVWTQVREDDGPYHGLWEFPGGKIEANEVPLDAAIREVEEEVGIKIRAEDARFLGIYNVPRTQKEILLYVFIFPDHPELEGRGKWLLINQNEMSEPFKGKIPPPNHQIIDELYRFLYSQQT